MIFLFLFSSGTSLALEILYTGCTNARFENCRCPNDPLGAMEKRTAEIERRREEGDVILVDSGDFMPATYDTLTARYVVEAMAVAGYDAVGVGDQELMQGPEILKMISGKLPLISANVVYPDGTPIADKVRIIQRGGDVYAFTALISKDALRFIPRERVDYFRVLDPDSALAAVRSEIPTGARFIVLSHSGETKDLKNAARWKGIDLIIGGHSQSVIEGVNKETSIPIVQAGGNGRYLGVAVFHGNRVRAELVPIRPEFPDDPRIITIVMKLKSARRKLLQPEPGTN